MWGFLVVSVVNTIYWEVPPSWELWLGCPSGRLSFWSVFQPAWVWKTLFNWLKNLSCSSFVPSRFARFFIVMFYSFLLTGISGSCQFNYLQVFGMFCSVCWKNTDYHDSGKKSGSFTKFNSSTDIIVTNTRREEMERIYLYSSARGLHWGSSVLIGGWLLIDGSLSKSW